MSIKTVLQHTIWLRNPLRILYHWLRGVVAFVFSGNPAQHMQIIGITGTKGKTTTSTMIAYALAQSGKNVCLISSAQIWVGSEKRENRSKMTMDSPFRLWKILREAKQKWVTHVVLETSSHGIYYFRNLGIRYSVVWLTNISQDHLDLHGTMEHYASTKARLFRGNKITILPSYNKYDDIFRQAITHNSPTVYYGNEATDVYRIITNTWHAPSMITEIQDHGESVSLQTWLPGDFNVYNTLLAYSVCREIGMMPDQLTGIWANFTWAPGRMEPVLNDKNISVIVDYAHTESSLQAALSTLQKTLSGGRLWVVFWATGDRDTTKRPKMGMVAHELADAIVVTDDDTYTEPSMKIIDMICEGIPRSIWPSFQVIPDRRQAIVYALQNALPWDTILIAGKWCETVQVTNEGVIPWSDRNIVEEILRT